MFVSILTHTVHSTVLTVTRPLIPLSGLGALIARQGEATKLPRSEQFHVNTDRESKLTDPHICFMTVIDGFIIQMTKFKG